MTLTGKSVDEIVQNEMRLERATAVIKAATTIDISDIANAAPARQRIMIDNVEALVRRRARSPELSQSLSEVRELVTA